MDYKEKYEKALGRAKTFSQRWQGIEATDSELALKELKEIFPELKENEDEKIRKEIISYLRGCYGANSEEYLISKRKQWTAWLEKQGEQKTAWSEEDENMNENIIETISNHYYIISDYKEMISWLKSIKERMKGE